MALIVGALLGILVSIPACSVLISMWKNITGIMTGTSVSVLKCAALCAAIILICIGFTFLSTSKISGISPVRAIAGGGSEPRLAGRHNLKIRRKPLSFFLALRFAMIALLGSAIGCAISMLYSRKVLRYVLRIVGITDFTTNYAPTLFLIPAALITLCCFFTVFLSAGRVKRVAVRELITE